MLSLQLHVAYQRTHRASGERDPLFLALYLDRYFERHVTMLVQPDQKGTQIVTIGGLYRGSSSAHFSRHGNNAGHVHESSTLTLPADASLCLQAYTTVANPEGILCRQEAGVGTLTLEQIQQAHQDKSIIEIPLRVHTTANNLVRGVVRIKTIRLDAHRAVFKGLPQSSDILVMAAMKQAANTVTVATVKEHNDIEHPYEQVLVEASLAAPTTTGFVAASGITTTTSTTTTTTTPSRLTRKNIDTVALRIRFAAPQPHENLACNVDAIGAEIERYMVAFSEERNHYANVHSGTARIACPLMPGELTVANTQLEVPFAVFVLHERPRITSRWWQSQWQLLARRRNFKDGRAMGEWLEREASIGEQAALAVTWCTQFVETLPYVSDMIGDREPVEMFGDMFAMLSGDCEDGASAILMVRDAMRHAGGELTHTASSPVEASMQSKMQHIARQYVDFLCIDGVTASHVAASKNGGGYGAQRECTAAHAALHCLPRDYVAACIGRWSSEHTSLARIRVDERFADGCLPVLVGEGTGVIDAGTEQDPVPEARQQFFQHQIIGCLKKQMFGVPGAESDFYKVVLFGATNLFFDSHRRATFHFTTRTAPHGARMEQGIHGNGVHYTQLMARSADVVLVPYGGQKKEFSEVQARILRSVAKNRIPPPPFTTMDEVAAVNASYGTRTRQICSNIEHRMQIWCQRINRRLAAQNRVGENGTNSSSGTTIVPVNIFPYAGQVGQDAFMEALEGAVMASARNASLVHVDFNMEAHHPCMQTVRIGLHCRHMSYAPSESHIGVKLKGNESAKENEKEKLEKKTIPSAVRLKPAKTAKRESRECTLNVKSFRSIIYNGDKALELQPDLNGSTPKLSLHYWPNVVPGATRLLTTLLGLRFVPLVQRIQGLRGCRVKKTPNFYYWVSDNQRAFYGFTKNQCLALEPHPFSAVPGLTALRERVEAFAGLPEGYYNAVLINYYPSKEATLSAHSDDDPWLYDSNDAREAQIATIASVSLGAQRLFRFVPKKSLPLLLNQPGMRDCGAPSTDDLKKPGIRLENGSLVMMEGETQRYWQHEIPAVGDTRMGGRVNLTFRRIFTDRFAVQYRGYLSQAQVRETFGHSLLTDGDLARLSLDRLRSLLRPQYATYSGQDGQTETIDLHALEERNSLTPLPQQ